jgi:hypothetical protein
MISGFLFQKSIQGFIGNAFGVSRPAVFSLAVTHLLFFVLFDFVKLAAHAGFNNHY